MRQATKKRGRPRIRGMDPYGEAMKLIRQGLAIAIKGNGEMSEYEWEIISMVYDILEEHDPHALPGPVEAN